MSDSNSSKGNILIVDDTIANLDFLSSLLEQQGYEIRGVTTGQLALPAIHSEPPDLILLDIKLPDISGYEICQELKQDPTTIDIPIIFISALDEAVDKVKAFRVGGNDYITKPFQIEEVMVRIDYQLTLYRQRKQIEQQTAAIEALREQERAHFENLNRTKDQFLAMASHDLKNPISVIIGTADLMLLQGATDKKYEERLERIKVAASQMKILVTDLLDLVKIETGLSVIPIRVSVNSLISTCIQNYEMLAHDKNIHLQASLLPHDLNIMLDKNRMAQVFNNLISNALKYTSSGGLVEVQVERGDDYVAIHVRDNGLGIPAEAIPHLFEKFYRVDSKDHMAAEGNGLGLTIVKSLVEQHSGKIDVVSELGQGSMFTVFLPLS